MKSIEYQFNEKLWHIPGMIRKNSSEMNLYTEHIEDAIDRHFAPYGMSAKASCLLHALHVLINEEAD